MLLLVSACSLDPPARSVIKVILQFCKEASMHRSFEAIQVRLSFRFPVHSLCQRSSHHQDLFSCAQTLDTGPMPVI